MYHGRHKRIDLIFVISLMVLTVVNTAYSSAPEDIMQQLKLPDAGNTQIITLKDGSSLVGQITHVGESEIKFSTELGEVTIEIDKITEIKEVPVSSFREGKYWFPDPNRTRLYFAPTARMLSAGEGYFSDYYLFFPGVAVGITDNITIGGGVSLFPFLEFGEQLFYFTPKVGLSAGKQVSLAAGALVVRIPDDDWDDPVFVGILYGVGTVGSEDNSLSIGIGYGFAGDELADKPAVMIGGSSRVARRIALVTESWIIPGVDEPLISYGVRFFGEGVSVDLAFVNILGEHAMFPGIPYMTFVWNF